jgi:anti-sigma-K factor RskA
MDHQEYQELLALHALDALDPAEARALEEHLGTCAQCCDDLSELRDTTGLLAYASTPAEPRNEVRAQILANLRPELREDPSAASQASARVVRLPGGSRTNLWPNLLKLAAAVAFVALLAGVLVLGWRDVQLRREIARLSREANTQQRELARDRDALAREREAIALLTSPSAKKTELTGTPTAENARATFAFDRQTGRAVLLTEGLPAAPADKAYELWFIANGHPMPGKVFTVDASGRATISDQVPPEARERAVFAVTLEPKHGVSAPTGAIYLRSPSS